MDLTGKNIVHYRLPNKQQKMIEKMFSIHSWPTYMIFGRNGELINSKAYSPKQGEHLIKQLEEALNTNVPKE